MQANVPSAPKANASQPELAELRAAIDAIDDRLHDLLMERAVVVERIGQLPSKSGVKTRPGREAAIIRRLLARHRGALPPQTLVRIWREMFFGFTAIEGKVAVAVCESAPDDGMAALAREHFGALVPLQLHATPARAIAQISGGAATAALLPLPTADEASAWWTSLPHGDGPRIHISARLPFWRRRPEGVTHAEGFVVAAVAPDASGADRSLIAFELPDGMSQASLASALSRAGFADASILLRRAGGEALAMVDVAGYLAEGDPRLSLADLPRPGVLLGAYATPIEGTPEVP
jgi:chorismate mutase / prephenate dehydratase